MANRQTEQKKVNGLALQSNSFTAPEGSFERLDNCVITQDNIVKKKRGASLFHEIGGVVSGRNLVEYGGKLVSLCSSAVQVYTQTSGGDFSSVATLGGSSFTIASGSKGRNVQSNGNLYFTASDGIYKVESTTANVLEAGIDPATDLQIFLQEQSSSETFFRPDSQVSYRILFGRKDANNNTVIGAPSQIVTASNTTVTKSATNTAGTVVVTDASHTLAVNDVIYVVNAVDTGIPDGNYTVTAQTPGVSFTFVANSGTGGALDLDYGTFKTTTLDFAIPSGVTSEYFYRVYRSSVSAAVDIPPEESTLQLIDEQNLTSGQITTGFVIYKDETPDILRGAYLYTNPNTGEPRGIAEANEKPPKSEDVAIFKNHVFYANIDPFYALTLSLITSNATTMPDACEFKITQGASVRTYKGYLDPKVGNRTVRATSVSFVTTTVTVTYNGHGFSNGDTIAVAEALDSAGAQLATLPQGNYTVANVAANTFDITAPSTPTGLTDISIAGVSNSGGKRIFYIEDSDTTSVASAIDSTARSIVRAINRDASAPCFAYYVSASDDIPGKMILRSKETSATFYVNAITSGIVDSFNPQIPTSGQDVIGTRDDGQGQLYFSKPNEPEAVPLANSIPVGSKSAAILRIAPLRDSLIVLKEDGCFRINGDNYQNFVATILDSTITLKATDSVAILDNQVYCFADQGIVAISETTAQIVSRAIEPVFTSIAGNSDMEANTHAVGYESERLYIIATISPTSDETDRVYVFNHLTKSWSTWNSDVFLDAYVKPSDDRLYRLNLSNTIYRERKNQNRLDFTERSYSGTVVSVPTSNSANINITGSDGVVGDVIVFNNIISRITDVTGTGASAVYTFVSDVTFEATDSVTLYKSITSEMRTAPFYAGMMSDLKQFSELKVDFRSKNSCSDMEIYFVSDSSASEATEWSANSQTGGWGNEPWGAFEWGLDEGINLPFETSPSQSARIYIPLEAQRSTFIQANMTHMVAAQNLMIQNISFTSRIYKQRTTR